jgi:hypothetical protein
VTEAVPPAPREPAPPPSAEPEGAAQSEPPARVSALAALSEVARWAVAGLRGYERALAAGLSVSIGALILFAVLQRHETALIRAALDAENRSIQTELEQALAAHTTVALRLARRWEQVPFDGASFERDVEGILATDPIFRGFEWRNSAFERVTAAPSLALMPGADLDSTEHSDVEVASAWVGDRPEGSASPTFETEGGRRLIAFAAPLFHGELAIGVITGVARLRDVLDQALGAAGSRGMCVAVHEGPERIYGPNPAWDGTAGRLRRTVPVNSGALTWEVEVWPSSDRLERMRSFGPPIVLLVGLFAAVFVAAALAPARPAR